MELEQKVAHGVVVVTAFSLQLSEPQGVSEHMRQSPQQATGTHQRKERSCWGCNSFIQTHEEHLSGARGRAELWPQRPRGEETVNTQMCKQCPLSWRDTPCWEASGRWGGVS